MISRAFNDRITGFIIHQRIRMVYDLHTHSTCSDGSLAPAALVAMAAEYGVTHMALTDHDTVSGVAEAQQAGQSCGVNVISGVEISSLWQGLDIHIVGLQLNSECPTLIARLEAQAERRMARAQAMCVRIAKDEADAWWAQLLALTEGRPPGRPDIATLLITNGRCRTRDEAFRKYLGTGKAGYVKTDWPTVETAVTWILEAGGIPVLAHPSRYKLTRSKLCRLIATFAEAGGRGMEVSGVGLDTNKVAQLGRLANEYGLLASKGSDFHTPATSWVRLGKTPPLPSICEPVWNLFPQQQD